MSARDRASIAARKKTLIAMTIDGATVEAIAAATNLRNGDVIALQRRWRAEGLLPAIQKTPEELEHEAFLEAKRRNVTTRLAMVRDVGIGREHNEPTQKEREEQARLMCFNHWRDLDKHHPKGWASYRIESERPRYVGAYASSHLSLVGSQADMCANA